jgi:DNA topoisomerase-6 subunit B
MASFEEISPSDFFYRNRDIAGFTNPARAIYASIRELVENSLDASDMLGNPSDIYLRLSYEGENVQNASVYSLRVMDNGSGVPDNHIPSAFGQILFGSKYRLRQARGTFGLGGTMAILYGQITTHKPAHIISSLGKSRIYEYNLMIDIQKNCPIILHRETQPNKRQWHGTVVEYHLEGDYSKAMPKVLEYLKQTALVNPYANITFVDPRGRLYKFTRGTTKMPPPPEEILPHPHGVDVEAIQRIVRITETDNMVDFMHTHFHRVSKNKAKRFFDFLNDIELDNIINEVKQRILEGPQEMENGERLIEEINQKLRRVTHSNPDKVINAIKQMLNRKKVQTATPLTQLIRQRVQSASFSLDKKNPKDLRPNEVVKVAQAMKKFDDFYPPNASCLSPLGEELLKTGVLKELNPEFVAVYQRKPSTYSGHPFIVETAIAYGGDIPRKNDFIIYRFANRIPLLYDEASDVTWKVIKTINWRRYKVTLDMPIAIITHVCSTKVPYKTVGKEFIADRPEVSREILNGLHAVARQLQRFISKKQSVERDKIRLNTFSKYLPQIARFSTGLAGMEKIPDINVLLVKVKKSEPSK